MSHYFLDSSAFAKLFVQEPGTDTLIQQMEAAEDNSRLISAATPLEVYAAIRRLERSGSIPPEAAQTILDTMRIESARMVQQPLNPAVLEAARQLMDRSEHAGLRTYEALQLGAAIVARELFAGLEVIYVSSDERMIRAARTEGFSIFNPVQETQQVQ